MSDGSSYFGHSFRQGALNAFQIAAAVAAFGLLIVLAERHNVRFDLTPTQSFVLSDEAQRVTEGLEKPVRVTIFYNSQQQDDRHRVEDLIDLFQNASTRISFRLLDLDRNPRLASELGVSSYNTGVVQSAGETISLKGIDQESVTGALLQLTRKQPRTLCFATGHGEHSPKDVSERRGYSEVAKALEMENFRIRTFDVIPASGVPADCTVLTFGGPMKDLLPGEAEHLHAFLKAGGRVLMLLDPEAPPSYSEFLNAYGIRPGDDIVVEERNRFYGADSYMPRVAVRREVFGDQLAAPAVFAVARTTLPGDENPQGAKIVLLALSSGDTWARVGGPPAEDEELSFRREIDHPGPLPMGVMVTGSSQVSEGGQPVAPLRGEMIVFGDADFASNLYLNILGNKDLFMSSIAVLAEDQELVAMRRKSELPGPLSPIYLTAEQARRIYWVAAVIVPGAVTLAGVLVVWRRRQKASR
jgi:ABC-type uncharacterized transport system involved in gliding motility auxiliary subunit